MNKTVLSILFSLIVSCGFGQSYLGWTTKQVNFRSGPGTEFEIISSLKPGTQIFIVSIETENDFYSVIDIATDKEGYLHKSFVKVGEKVAVNQEGAFTITGKTSNINPQVEIYNNTSTTLTLKVNNDRYMFSPFERKTIDLFAGKCSYRASAPGVIPNIGVESLESNMLYNWEFYIVTERK
jgi:uncharacterized protein YgiM (DUF1202 family)